MTQKMDEFPPECKTEAEKTAFAFGWWKAMEAMREKDQDEPVLWLRDPKHYPEEDSIVPHVSWKKERLNTIPLTYWPQPRPWVGLTPEQKLSLEIQGNKSDVMLAELVESWLKDMNT